MFPNEAKWISNVVIKILGGELSPILIVGSQNKNYIEKIQPWIDKYIYQQMIQMKIKYFNLDIQSAQGIDITMDFVNEKNLNAIHEINIKSVLCSNFLEHVSSPKECAKKLMSVVPKDGHLIITVPYKFPYHEDPIDNRLRPNVNELHSFFPRTELVCGNIVDCGTYKEWLDYSKVDILRRFIRLMVNFYKLKCWRNEISYLKYYSTQFQATCVLLKKLDEIP